MPITDVSNMKVADLKRELKLRGLSVTGNKTELQERLSGVIDGEPLLEDGSLVDDDILDEEEGVLSDEEKILGSDENELLISPTTISPKILATENKDVSTIEDDILESPAAITKKIVLNRKSSLNNSNSSDTNATTAKENTQSSPAKMSERNPITMGEERRVEIDQVEPATTKKLKQLTMQERLEIRAKKFGIDAKPAVVTTTAKNAISMAPVVSSEKQVELLKKRAERFGCVTSTNLAKLDAEERLLKRKQRFGGEAEVATKVKIAENITTSTDNGNDEWAEKARKRLERFKGNSMPTVTVAAATEVAATAVAANST